MIMLFIVKKDDIEYLQFRRLLEYEDNIKHAFSLGINYDFRISNKMTEEQQEHNKACYKNICKYFGIKPEISTIKRMNFEKLDNKKYNEQAFQKFRKKYVANINGGSTKKLIDENKKKRNKNK